jgi:hypothetical protein
VRRVPELRTARSQKGGRVITPHSADTPILMKTPMQACNLTRDQEQNLARGWYWIRRAGATGGALAWEVAWFRGAASGWLVAGSMYDEHAPAADVAERHEWQLGPRVELWVDPVTSGIVSSNEQAAH